MKQIILLIAVAVLLCGCPKVPGLKNFIKNCSMEAGSSLSECSYSYDLQLDSAVQWALVVKNGKDETILTTPEMTTSGDVSLKIIITDKPEKQITVTVEDKTQEIKLSRSLDDFPGEVAMSRSIVGKKYVFMSSENEIGAISFATRAEVDRLRGADLRNATIIDHLKLIIQIKPQNANEPAKNEF